MGVIRRFIFTFLFVMISEVGATVDKRCPSNVTIRHDDRWTACTFPNVLTNQRGCGRPRNETWNFRLCDPNYLFTYEAGWALEEFVREAEETSPYTCNNIRDSPQNFTYAFAIVNKIAVPDLTSPNTCINDCGAILPKLEGRDATEEEINTAMEQLASRIRRQWALGTCGNDIIVLYSKQYQVAYTSVGEKASATLTNGRLQSLNKGAVDYYFKRDQLSEGIKYLVSAYKQALLGFSPAYIMMIINAGLILFTLLCLFLLMNIGREVKVLYDESIPALAVKYILYAISLLWIIKWWMWFLGWVEQKPKTRTAYIVLPAVVGFLFVLVAWISSPSTLNQLHDRISKQ